MLYLRYILIVIAYVIVHTYPAMAMPQSTSCEYYSVDIVSFYNEGIPGTVLLSNKFGINRNVLSEDKIVYTGPMFSTITATGKDFQTINGTLSPRGLNFFMYVRNPKTQTYTTSSETTMLDYINQIALANSNPDILKTKQDFVIPAPTQPEYQPVFDNPLNLHVERTVTEQNGKQLAIYSYSNDLFSQNLDDANLQGITYGMLVEDCEKDTEIFSLIITDAYVTIDNQKIPVRRVQTCTLLNSKEIDITQNEAVLEALAPLQKIITDFQMEEPQDIEVPSWVHETCVALDIRQMANAIVVEQKSNPGWLSSAVNTSLKWWGVGQSVLSKMVSFTKDQMIKDIHGTASRIENETLRGWLLSIGELSAHCYTAVSTGLDIRSTMNGTPEAAEIASELAFTKLREFAGLPADSSINLGYAAGKKYLEIQHGVTPPANMDIVYSVAMAGKTISDDNDTFQAMREQFATVQQSTSEESLKNDIQNYMVGWTKGSWNDYTYTWDTKYAPGTMPTGFETSTSVINRFMKNNFSASYTGNVTVGAISKEGNTSTRPGGAISLDLNFAQRNFTGVANIQSLDDGNGSHWYALKQTFAGLISSNGLSGSVTSMKNLDTGGNFSITQSTFNGKFFGPSAEGVGGVFSATTTLNEKVVGSFGAKR